jgi:hypothetical protein
MSEQPSNQGGVANSAPNPLARWANAMILSWSVIWSVIKSMATYRSRSYCSSYLISMPLI